MTTKKSSTRVALGGNQEFCRGDASVAPTVLTMRDVTGAFEKLTEAGSVFALLDAALEIDFGRGLLTNERTDYITSGGGVWTCNEVKQILEEVLDKLEPTDTSDHPLDCRVADVRRELFDLWNLVAVAEHSLAAGNPLHGGHMSHYPARSLVQIITEMIDKAAQGIDQLIPGYYEELEAKQRAGSGVAS